MAVTLHRQAGKCREIGAGRRSILDVDGAQPISALLISRAARFADGTPSPEPRLFAG